MPDPLLGGGLAAIAVAIVLVVFLLRRDRGPAGVSDVLASIERHYGGQATPKDAPDRAGRLAPALRPLRALAERLAPSTVGATLQRRLDAAGNPGAWTTERVLAYKGLGLVGAGLVFALVSLGDRPLSALVLGPAGAAIGYFLPDLLLYNA